MPGARRLAARVQDHYDIDPHAEVVGYDDNGWELVDPADLGGRRGGGIVSFFWFRATLTIPPEAQGFATAGAKAAIEAAGGSLTAGPVSDGPGWRIAVRVPVEKTGAASKGATGTGRTGATAAGGATQDDLGGRMGA